MDSQQQIEPETIELIPTSNPKHEGYIALRQQGYNASQAAVMLGYDRSHSNRLEKKYNKYMVSGDKKLLRLAHTNLKNMLQPDSEVKDSVRLGCINTVLDRNDPVIRKQETLNVNVNLSPVDIERWRR